MSAELFSLTALGDDRPGIVAAVSAVLFEQGCNLEESAMTRLRGQFAIVLVVRAPEGVGAEALRHALDPPARAFGLVVDVRPVGDTPAKGGAGEEWVVSVHGADHPGIVHGITAALARAGANIVDLSTRVVGTEDAPAYVMTMTVALPPGAGGAGVAEGLRELGSSLGVHCAMHKAEADIL